MVKESIPIGCRQKSKTPFGENIVGVQIDIFTHPSVSISFKNMNLPTLKRQTANKEKK